MDCRGFLTRIEAFIDGSIATEERVAADGHLAACPRCREIVKITGADLAFLSVESPEGLAESILERTSGRPCTAALERLGDYVDGVLWSVDRDLVQGHLDHCGHCAGVMVVLTRLADDLPALAELGPDPGFTSSVVAAIATREPSSVRAGVPWWPGLLGRSRLAWEAGYVGAIVLWLVFGASWAPLRATSERALAVVQENHVRSVVETMRSTLRGDEAGTSWDRFWSSLRRER